MESIVKLTSYLSNDKKLDLRLESAACKEWNTWQGRKTLQMIVSDIKPAGN